MIPPRSRVRASILFCLFLSGAAGLVYEVLWARILGLTFGHTVYAVTTVLAAFMGGMAIGSLVLGRLVDRVRSPLLLYGLFEAVIGLYCLFAPWLLGLARGLYLAFYPSLAAAPAARTLVQFALSLLVLLVPTFLMGGTLPAAVKGLSDDVRNTGRWTSVIYGINTLGAAAGAFAAGYWSLPTLGNARSNLAAVAMNLLAGAVVLLGVRSVRANQDGEVQKLAEPLGAQRDAAPARLDRLLLVGIAVSGAVAMSCQVLWTRALILVIGSSTYAFSCILVTVLIGLALGSLLFPRLPSLGTPKGFAVLQALIGAGCAFLLPFFWALPRVFVTLFADYRGGYGLILWIQFLLAGSVILIPSIFMGMTVPCAVAALSRRRDRMGREVGRVLAWNTWGAVLGSVLAGFALIPLLGVQRALILCIATNLLVAVAVLGELDPNRRGVLAAAWAALLAVLLLLPMWSRQLMVSGPAVYPTSFFTSDAVMGVRPLHETWDVLFFEEGVSSTVAVVQNQDGVRSMRVNGRTEAGTQPTDLESFIKLAYLPMALHSAPRRVAILGLGAGVSAFTASRFDAPERVDVVEIDPSVGRAQRVFSPGELDAFADSRVRLTVDDGRSFLEAPGAPYDVIICGPSQTWAAGVANLFTTEFLEAARRRLAPGGILCLWMHGYFLDRQDLAMVFRTFRDVFPSATVWEGDFANYFLIGKDGEWPAMDLGVLLDRIGKESRLAAFLRSQGEDPVDALLTSFRLDPQQLAAFAGNGPLNTDDRNILEFHAPKGLYLPPSSDLSSELQSFAASPYPSFVSDPRLEQPSALLAMGEYLLNRKRPGQSLRFIRRIPSRMQPATGGSGSAPIARLQVPGGVLVETFDGPPVLPFYPLAGGYRPEKASAVELLDWESYQELFARISGPAPGAGLDGSTALSFATLFTPMPLACLFPLEVSPDALYEVSFRMRSDSPVEVEAGAGHVQYGAVIPYDASFTLEWHTANLRGGEVGAVVKGASPWARHRFVMRTGPQTRMVHLQLFRFGPAAGGEVLFDDLSVRRLG